MFVIRVFNGTWFGVFGIFLALFAFLTFLARRMDEKGRRRFLAGIMLAGLAAFAVYKFMISVDGEYSRITQESGKGAFSWWQELPLHLCNINMILIPVAVLTGKRPLMSFCFFLGSLGALMALAMPSDGFDGYSVLTPRVAGYYATHWIVFFGSLSLCGFGLYRPNMKDVLPTLLSALCVSLVIFGVDVLMRRTGINEHANYFYLMETEGNAILEAFHSLIPVPYLYILPCFGILAPYILIVTAGFALADRKRR